MSVPEGSQAIVQVVPSVMHLSLVQAHLQERKVLSRWSPRRRFWRRVCETGERLSEPRPLNTDNQCFSTRSQDRGVKTCYYIYYYILLLRV